MPSFRTHFGKATALALMGSFLGGCVHSPETVAFRDRLENGFQTPEDIVRFKVREDDRRAATAEARDFRPLAEKSLDTQLIGASAKGDIVQMRSFLALGARVNSVNSLRQSSLYLAAREGEAEAMRLLIKAGADIDGRGSEMSPLAVAALMGHTHCVQLLIRNRADLNLVGENGHSPLMNAVKLNRLSVAKVLLDAGAETQSLDRSGDSLLVVAINENLPEMFRLLLQSGVKPDVPDSNGLTPLYWAQFLKRPILADLLIQAGADPSRTAVRSIVSRPYNFGEF